MVGRRARQSRRASASKRAIVRRASESRSTSTAPSAPMPASIQPFRCTSRTGDSSSGRSTIAYSEVIGGLMLRRSSEALHGLGGGVRAALDLEGEHLVARSEEHTSELQSLMRISYAVLCLQK